MRDSDSAEVRDKPSGRGKQEAPVKKLVLYVHGVSGSIAESEHYRSLFPEYEVLGLDYQIVTPWETSVEIHDAVEQMRTRYEKIILIANSIGAYFCMAAGIDRFIEKAFFISPVVDMEGRTLELMRQAWVSEDELKEKGVIQTGTEEDLLQDILRYARNHSINWSVPTQILYGMDDCLTSHEEICAFANTHNASLTVMEEGKHWFHTEAQMRFLDDWIRQSMYRINRESVTPEEYIDFLKRTDLGSQYPRERFEERIARLVNSVSISLTARNDEGMLIGVLFGLTDFAYWLYVTDLGVDRRYERLGIGRRLMRTAHEIAGGEKDIAVYLIANENAVPFYEKLGMEKAEDVMQYKRIEWTEFTVE